MSLLKGSDGYKVLQLLVPLYMDITGCDVQRQKCTPLRKKILPQEWEMDTSSHHTRLCVTSIKGDTDKSWRVFLRHVIETGF